MVKKISNLIHIFGGIPTVRFGKRRKPENNLAALQNDFRRFGIRIEPNCKIANSTLERLIHTINTNVKPLSPTAEAFLDEFLEKYEVDPNWRPDPSIENERPFTREAIEEIERALNFNISIGPSVIIGERVGLGPGIQIGANTKIGEKVDICPGTVIGKNCIIGKGAYFSEGCTIGDNTSVATRTVFAANTKVPPNSIVEHEGSDSTMAKVRSRFTVI